MPPDAPKDPFDTPLDALDLPMRLDAIAMRHRLGTVRDLIVFGLSALHREPNFGPLSVSRTREALEVHLGLTWSDARRHVFGAAAVAPPPSLEPYRWNDLRNILPDAVRARRLDTLPLFPARLRNLARALGLATVGELVERPSRTWLRSAGVGRGSLAQALAMIVELVDAERSRAGSAEEPDRDVLELWRRCLASLTESDRAVLSLRAGVGAASATQQEVGRQLGVTGNRVSQIEARALAWLSRDGRWGDVVEARLRAALADHAAPLDAVVAADPWLRPLRDEPAFARYVLDQTLRATYDVFSVDGTTVLAGFSAHALDAAWSALHRSLLGGPWPQTRRDVAERVAAAAAPFGALIAQAFARRADAGCVVDPAEPDRVVRYRASPRGGRPARGAAPA